MLTITVSIIITVALAAYTYIQYVLYNIKRERESSVSLSYIFLGYYTSLYLVSAFF